jgi:glutamate---cysteine ligase / carboxylate-amine ligase
MGIRFTHNARPTVGVELELHLIDRNTGDLVSASDAVLDRMGAGQPGGEHPRAKHELFQSTVEIITGVCDTPAEVHSDLQGTLADLRGVASDLGVGLISSGTHPFALVNEQLVSASPRYEELIESMQWPARRLLICGMHVHVGVSDGERAIAIINEISRYLPLLLALSSSSPFFEGEDSGLASARSKVFEALPTAGLPPVIADWVDFEAFMTTLLATECISSIREVWWDIRPHPDFGTIELRMCDSPPTLSEATALAALAQAMVIWCGRQLDAGKLPAPPREWTVRENRWLAGRFGIDAELIVEEPGGLVRRRPVTELVEELVDQLLPIANELGSGAELAGVGDILASGSGAQRQRRVIEGGGTLLDVVRHLENELIADRPLL